jgi:hypothetical protein
MVEIFASRKIIADSGFQISLSLVKEAPGVSNNGEICHRVLEYTNRIDGGKQTAEDSQISPVEKCLTT